MRIITRVLWTTRVVRSSTWIPMMRSNDPQFRDVFDIIRPSASRPRWWMGQRRVSSRIPVVAIVPIALMISVVVVLLPLPQPPTTTMIVNSIGTTRRRTIREIITWYPPGVRSSSTKGSCRSSIHSFCRTSITWSHMRLRIVRRRDPSPWPNTVARTITSCLETRTIVNATARTRCAFDVDWLTKRRGSDRIFTSADKATTFICGLITKNV